MNVRALPPQHQVNANILVIGGSGAGKTRFFIKPNLMQAECSYIVCDPKGETYRAVGGLLEKMGYEMTIFNLIDMKQSDCYNPFAYLHTDVDAFRLINTLIQNTTPQKSQTSDPFWDKAETAFLSALILYLFHEAPESERNFGTLMYMVINAEAREEDESYRSPVDLLFDDLERVDEDHIAVKNWKVFKQAGPKTAKSILVSASTRLAAFNTEEMARLTSRDDLSLGTLGDRKRVIFAVIPDEDTTFNYLVGLLYSQAFRELYHAADNKYGGRLPVPVRVLMDEFANVALPEDFERVLATCRSREISINIVIQNMAQLKKLFKDSWENVTGNCDTLLYLGGNEASTHEYISKMLGIVSSVAGNLGNLTGASVALPEEIKTAIDEVGFLASIPLWLVTILGSVFITVLSFVMILTVYSRFFRLYMYTALAPIPLSTFAGDMTSNTGRTFIKSYLGVCMEGAVIVLSVSPKSASKGTTVTVTVTPDKGYVLETLTVTDASGKKLDLKNLGSGKYSFTMPASKVEVKATFMEDNTMLNYFVDVPASAYYYDAVLWAAEQGITGGTDATHFSPDGVCTRAQAVTFLWRAAGSPAPSTTAMPFTDVAADSYYYNAVLWAMENGITVGTSSTTFSPDLKCSRAHIMTFLWRSEKSPAAGSVNPFTDVSADAYYADAVLWPVKESVTNGTSSATFSPDADCTRAQIVTFIWRALTR